MTDYQQRKYDIVVFGATGFTGALTAEYISINWALAGRSLAKLEKVRDQLADLDPSKKDLDLLIADTNQPETLDELISQTRVIMSTVGPYVKYGTPLVEACIRQKTHYVDITGEYGWMKDMIDRFDEKAKQEKVLIVPGCGFDSVPSDLGVFILSSYMQQTHNLHLSQVKSSVIKYKGGISGGTVQSLLEAVTQRDKDHTDPYLLATRRGVDRPSFSFLRKDYDFGGLWQGLFIMAPINEKVVRRSWSIWTDRGNTYGNTFSYKEYQSFNFLPGVVYACFLYTIVPFAVLLAGLPVIGEKFKNLLPGSGYGPDAEKRKTGCFEMQFVGTAETEPYDDIVRARATVKGFRDPGYGDTCRMLTESALSIIKSPKDIPGKEGGVLTPATAFGQILVDRLKANGGMLFEVQDIQ
ncbi:hypothetical protein G6F56_001828 [Rhizopus delemar]|uniref:Saccharopine dehydrogenase NADP binding domain-containing protein n=1 Tax=Rhizopus stolonifer TaxID=4846 RepID=A0A367KQP7_RHIST|nr:hypothetical protein G6F56_001828 [Rhizopus delemar]RCI04516.1 hypothetical protein CU098_011920 [Rhizopus stolonifer]